eukprot:10822804-Alexandrium_andersonii.AAC.1
MFDCVPTASCASSRLGGPGVLPSPGPTQKTPSARAPETFGGAWVGPEPPDEKGRAGSCSKAA